MHRISRIRFSIMFGERMVLAFLPHLLEWVQKWIGSHQLESGGSLAEDVVDILSVKRENRALEKVITFPVKPSLRPSSHSSFR